MAMTFNRLYIEVNKDVQDIITAVQGDTHSRFLDVTLFSNGTPINLTDHVVRIYMKKPDGTEIFNVGDITEPTNGRAQFELTSQALAVAGVLETQIIVFDNKETEILSTNKFNIFITKSLISDNSIESSNEYGALVILFQNVYEAIHGIKEINDKIGVVGAKGEELSTDTLFKELEYLIDFSEKNSVGSLGVKVDKLIEDTKVLKENVPVNWNILSNVQGNRVSLSSISTEKTITNISGSGHLILAIFEPYFTTSGDITFKVEIDGNLIFNCKFIRKESTGNKTFSMGIINDNYYNRLVNNNNNIRKFIDFYSGVRMPLSKDLFTIDYEIDAGSNITPIATSVVTNPIKFNSRLRILASSTSNVERGELKFIYSS